MRKLCRRSLSLLLAAMLILSVFAGSAITVGAAAIGDPNYRIKADADFTVGSFVYEYNILDWGGDNTGGRDNTDVLQSIINKLGNLGGGTVYLPSGKYKITGNITLRKGVTIRGDWQKPEKGQPIGGTILMA